MLLFRSEEHLEEWLRQKGGTRGGTLTLDQLGSLAAEWYSGRLAREWQPRPRERSQEILTSVGLTGPFWQLG